MFKSQKDQMQCLLHGMIVVEGCSTCNLLPCGLIIWGNATGLTISQPAKCDSFANDLCVFVCVCCVCVWWWLCNYYNYSVLWMNSEYLT